MARSASESKSTGDARVSLRQAARAVIWLVVLTGIVAALRFLPVESYLLGFVEWVRGQGWSGMVAYVLAYVLACVLLVPGSILTLGAGFAYGVIVGTPVVWVGASIGALLAFVLGRTLLRGWIAAKVGSNPKFSAIDRAVGQNGFKIVLLTRLSPVFPFNLLNYGFGLTQVSARDYFVGTMVGILPGTLMYVYLGSLVTSVTELAARKSNGGSAQQILYFVGLAVTIVICVYVTRVARRALAEATSGDTASSG